MAGRNDDGLTPDAAALVAFSSGVASDGTLAAVSAWRWDKNTPPTYRNDADSAHKWDGGAAGTPGSVRYAFDPGSAWTPAEQASFRAAMTLWSDIAAITFSPADPSSAASAAPFVIYRYGTPSPPPGGLDPGSYAGAVHANGRPGDSTLPATERAMLSIQTDTPTDDLASFTARGGWGIATVVHELGHILGLDHTGPYDGNVDPATQQLNPYDTRLWSIMSYIDPANGSARYSDAYPVTGTAWGQAEDRYPRQPTTPMMLDIVAAQRLYGTPAHTALAGGQVFGFNCNVTDAARPFFDFTVDTAPIVTLWDAGRGNTLDLSGYATSSLVDLNPGHFSSFAGMTNNLGIAAGTRIDHAIGGRGDDTFIVNADGNAIEGGGGTDTVRFAGRLAQYSLARSGAVVTAVATDPAVGGTYRLSDVTTLQFADQTMQAASIADGGPLAPLNAAQQELVGFMNGVDANGVLTSANGWTWNGNDPATYGTDGSAHKWAGGATGTPGTISYWVDPGSAWTDTETASFLASMSLWSSLANVRFTAAPDLDSATFAFYRYGTPTPPEPLSAGAYARAYYDAGAAGAPTLPAIQGAYLSIDTTVPQWSQLGSFTTYGGEGPGTVVHELGHVLGLFHAGPYNTTADVATQQLNQYDTQLWSTMSYISPMTPGAKYADQYPVTGTAWGQTAEGKTREPTTPMMLDIPAIQQLYGLPEGGAFTGGQVFGFNCNITAACRPYFDFTVNPTPVITIWDPGADNTLDLSGYGTRCVVDLNPGTFSSFAGMTNNLGIAFGSRIDRAIGGAGDDRFVVNAGSDTIDGGAGTNDVVFAGRVADYALSRSGGIVTVAATDASLGGTYTLTNVASLVFQDVTVETGTIPCFVTGTRIATPDGWTPVERLRIGDRVLLHDGSVMPVRWLGSRRIDCRRHADPASVQPIRIRAGSFGPNQPRRDLFLSPDHAVLVDGVLVPVRYLVDRVDIAQVPRRTVTYWHVELPRHEVLIAEGVPAESYLDTGDRDRFAASTAAPPVCPEWSAELRCRPLAVRRPGALVAATKGAALQRMRSASAARERTSHEVERT